jgi:hypothetical protein
MIGQLHRSSSAPGAAGAAMTGFVEEALLEAKKHGGVVGALWMRDPSTGENISVTVFRDQAAIDAFRSFEAEKIAAAESDLGATVGAASTFSEVIIAM